MELNSKTTLKWKVFAPVLALYLLVFAVSMVLFFRKLEEEVYSQVKNRVVSISQSLISSAEVLQDSNQIQRLIQFMSALSDVNFLEIVDGQTGLVLASSQATRIQQPMGDIEGFPINKEVLEQVMNTHRPEIFVTGAKVVLVSHMLLHRENKNGYKDGILIVDLDTKSFHGERFKFMFFPLSLFLVLMVGLAIVVFYLLVIFVDRPVEHIVQTLKDWSQGKNKARVTKKFNSILDDVGGEINHVFEVIDSANQKIQDQQSQIAQAAKMSALGVMSAGIAHEINNPLAIIYGRAGVLIRRLHGQTFEKDELLSHAIIIEATAERISKIIKGLKDFSQSSHKLPAQISSLEEIFEGTLSLARERFRTSGIPLRVPQFPEIKLICRPVQISEVLLNLLNNAFDAVSELPEKWVELRVHLSENEKRLSIFVIDAGKGISGDVLKNMMTPFYTTKPVGKGTGLGLSISKGIIESHGGTFNYQLIEGHTAFVIELPLEGLESKGPILL